MIMIEVSAVQGGWRVSADAVMANNMFFLSGRAAERAARRIAAAIAPGRTVELLIYLRDGSLGGRLVESLKGQWRQAHMNSADAPLRVASASLQSAGLAVIPANILAPLPVSRPGPESSVSVG